MPETRHLTDDERYDLAMVAAASERSNRPKNLIVIPLLLFVVASIMLIYGLFTLESGRVQLRSQESRVNNLINNIVILKELEQTGEAPGEEGILDPIPDFLTRAEACATDAKLAKSPALPATRRDRYPGFVRVRQVYSNVVDPSLPALLEWVRLTQERIPGIFVYSLALKPAGDRGWTLDVTYARWEREGQS